MKIVIYLLTLTFLLSGCGLKKPLENPDELYPNEPDCTCDNPEDE